MVLGAVALVLAGCSAAPTAAPAPSETSSPSSTPAPTSAPTPTPTPEPTRPALRELVLSPGGFEQLPLGIDPATIDPAVSIVEATPLECDPATLSWHAVESAFPTDAQGHRPFAIAVRDSQVRAIQVVWSRDIKTAEGIQIGSTRQALLDAYPGIDVVISDQRGDVYVVRDDRGWMRMSVFYETETVSEMLATTNDIPVSAPSYHTIDAACL